MKNLDNGMEYLWSRDKFLNRFDLMKELYRRFQLQMYGEGDPEDYGDENGSLRISNARTFTISTRSTVHTMFLGP